MLSNAFNDLFLCWRTIARQTSLRVRHDSGESLNKCNNAIHLVLHVKQILRDIQPYYYFSHKKTIQHEIAGNIFPF